MSAVELKRGSGGTAHVVLEDVVVDDGNVDNREDGKESTENTESRKSRISTRSFKKANEEKIRTST